MIAPPVKEEKKATEETSIGMVSVSDSESFILDDANQNPFAPVARTGHLNQKQAWDQFMSVNDQSILPGPASSISSMYVGVTNADGLKSNPGDLEMQESLEAEMVEHMETHTFSSADLDEMKEQINKASDPDLGTSKVEVPKSEAGAGSGQTHQTATAVVPEVPGAATSKSQ
jgi:hypothetical protein